MSEALPLLLSLLAGVLIGLIFFGGLWWTLKRGLPSEQPALWFTLSFVVRAGLALLGFYWLAQSDWQQVLMGLLGFWLARLLVSYGLPPSTTLNPQLALLASSPTEVPDASES